MPQLTLTPKAFKNGSNRVLRLKYGNGCEYHKNCFTCPIPISKCPFMSWRGVMENSTRVVYVSADDIFSEAGGA